eukprot:scaffold14414_cov176-Skeletonema_dohrnii-CCMP3373.AAC.2
MLGEPRCIQNKRGYSLRCVSSTQDQKCMVAVALPPGQPGVPSSLAIEVALQHKYLAHHNKATEDK